MKKLMFVVAVALFAWPQLVYAQGCIEPTSDEGVQVIGYIQPEFRYDFLGTDNRGENLDESSFYFNRLRLGVTGNIPYDFSYYAIAELSPTLGGPHILDAYVSYNRFGPWAKISVGQFKNPFGLELSTACHRLYTINRSAVVQNLVGPFRDFGVMISGGTDSLSILGTKTKNLFGYQIALMNGNGMNIQDNNQYKDIIGRVTFHPFNFITIGANYRFGKHPAITTTATEEDRRKRFGLDVQLQYRDFLIQGEYINGSDIGSYTTGGGCGDPFEVHEGSVDRKGYFVQAIYNTPWNIQPVLKYEYFEPNKDVEVVNDQFSTITYGLNIYPNEWTRLQVNYLYNVEENGLVEHSNDALLIQVQVTF